MFCQWNLKLFSLWFYIFLFFFVLVCVFFVGVCLMFSHGVACFKWVYVILDPLPLPAFSGHVLFVLKLLTPLVVPDSA